jgi:hypothetical protein
MTSSRPYVPVPRRRCRHVDMSRDVDAAPLRPGTCPNLDGVGVAVHSVVVLRRHRL